MSIEKVAEQVVGEVKAEVAKVEEKAKAVVGEVVAEAKQEVEKLVQELTAEEKLVIRNIENEFLKAQMEIQRLQQVTQGAQTNFKNYTENLAKKYVLDPALFVFDTITLQFKKK